MTRTFALAMIELGDKNSPPAVYLLKDPVDTENIIIDCKEILEHLAADSKYTPGTFVRGRILDRIDTYLNGPPK